MVRASPQRESPWKDPEERKRGIGYSEGGPEAIKLQKCRSQKPGEPENLGCCFKINRASLMAQMRKNLSAMQETWVRSLGQENPLEKGMATHSNILVWRIPWTEESGGLQSMGSWRVGHDWTSNTFTFKINGELLEGL